MNISILIIDTVILPFPSSIYLFFLQIKGLMCSVVLKIKEKPIDTQLCKSYSLGVLGVILDTVV